MTTQKLQVLDLFSGIGGFSLGLERAGMRTVAFCEQDGFACRVLRKRWPTIPIFEDVRTLTSKRLEKHGIKAQVLCGGFPCQDISQGGKRVGIEGERSGLWREYARIIREIRPDYAILENVGALRWTGLDVVLGELASIGYDAEWHCIQAAYVGAPQHRDRMWIVAYPRRVYGHGSSKASEKRSYLGQRIELARPSHRTHVWPEGYQATQDKGRSFAASLVCRKSDGIPHRVDRLRCLGNTVVPQIVEMIGRGILADHSRRQA